MGQVRACAPRPWPRGRRHSPRADGVARGSSSGEWLRTYRSHRDRAGDPLADPGAKDITCEVPVDQLDDPGPPTEEAQADWLRRHGIEALVEEGRRVWSERAHMATSRRSGHAAVSGKPNALLDPGGLGAFRVLTWTVGERPGTG